MSAYGVPEADIARVLGIDPKTLRKHYRDELDTGSIKANSRMAENLYRKAMGDGPAGGDRDDLLAQDAGSVEGDHRPGAARHPQSRS